MTASSGSPRVLRAALTQTHNAFADMPARLEDLPALAPRLDEVRAANVAHHLDLLGAAVERGAVLVGFGELFAAPYFGLSREPMWHALAEDARDGPTITAVREAAARHRVVVVAPIYELDADTGRRFNTAVVVERDGEVLGTFRKMHIPAGRNEQGGFDEAFYYEPGDGTQPRSPAMRGEDPRYPAFETSVGTIGVSICYDRHFEGVVRTLARAGAEVVISPAVTFGAQSRRMWDLEFAVDAMRHRVYVGGSNRAGAERPWDQPFFGASHFVGPAGPCEDLSDRPDLVIADLDLDARVDDGSGWALGPDVHV